MGRKRDPDYIRAKKGKSPRLPPGETLTFPADEPQPPTFLTTEAVKCWCRLAPQLKKAGILLRIGQDKMATYCQAYSDYAQIMEELKLLGLKRFKVIKADRDSAKFKMSMLKLAIEIMRNFESEYGLTPASATKIRRPLGAGGANPQEKFQGYLDKGSET